MQLRIRLTLSQVRRSPQVLSVISVFWLSVVGAALTGFDLEATIRLSLVCAVVSVSGVFLFTPSRHISNRIIPELIAWGIAVGIPTAALSHQLFLHSALRSVGWLIPTLLVIPRVVSHLRSISGITSMESSESVNELIAVITFSFISMFAAGWWFLFPPCLLLVGFLIVKQVRFMHRKTISIGTKRDPICILIFGSIFFVSISIARYFAGKNFFYFFRSFDQLFRSAVAKGLNEWGASDHIAAVGTPLRYHWLAEASVGLIAKLSGSPALPVLSRFAPFIFTVARCAALWSLTKRFGLSYTGITLSFGCILWLTQTVDLYTIRQPLVLAVFFLFLNGLANYESSPRKLKSLLQIALFCPLILLIDTPLGVIVCVTTFLIGLLNGVLARISWRDSLLLIVVGPLSLWLLKITLLNSKSEMIYTPIFGVRNVLQFGKNAFDIYSGESWRSTALVSLALLTYGSFRWIGIFGPQDLRRLLHAPHITCLVPALVGLLLANIFSMGASIGDAVQGVFLVGLVALPLLSADSITEDFAHERHRFEFWIPSVMLGVIGGISLHNAFGLEIGSRRQFSLVSIMTIPVIILFAVRLVEWSLKHFDKARRYRVRVVRQGIQVVILVALLASSSFGIFDGVRNINMSIQDDHGFLGTTTQLECLTWIRENTDRQSILVSNLWRIPLPTQDQKYFLVSSQSERRILIDGPLYIDYYLSGDVAKRMSQSEEFINYPSQGSFDYMKSMKVSVVYVDFQYSDNRNLEPYATTVFINGGCLVAILN